MKELIDFIILIILYFVLFYKKWKLKGKDVLLINTTMYIYLSFVFYFTLMPIFSSIPTIINHMVFNHHYKQMNLIPFIDVTMGRGDFVRQILLNVIMTIPFGILLPIIINTKLSKIIFYTFLLSLNIEFLQLITNCGRSSDITDIITNCIGGIIGYGIYLVIKPLTTKILNYIRNS